MPSYDDLFPTASKYTLDSYKPEPLKNFMEFIEEHSITSESEFIYAVVMKLHTIQLRAVLISDTAIRGVSSLDQLTFLHSINKWVIYQSSGETTVTPLVFVLEEFCVQHILIDMQTSDAFDKLTALLSEIYYNLIGKCCL